LLLQTLVLEFFNYFNFIEPLIYGDKIDQVRAKKIIDSAYWFLNINLVVLITQIINVFVSCLVMKKVHKGFKWNLFFVYLIEWIILSMPSILLLATLPSWICATRLIYTDKFTYITAAKPTINETLIIKEEKVENV